MEQVPGAAGDVIALPPMASPAPAPASDSRLGSGARRFLLLLVLILAFLSASFPARNSDLWLHLATGRLLWNGELSFGTDPFTYTSADQFWVNHAWLWDMALYGLYLAAGEAYFGTVAVALKAALMALLAFLLLQMRQKKDAVWLPAACTALAILAMAPRLLLQPVCFSYFFLGLTFWLLWRAGLRFAPAVSHAFAGTRPDSPPKPLLLAGTTLSGCAAGVSAVPPGAAPLRRTLWFPGASQPIRGARLRAPDRSPPHAGSLFPGEP